MKYEGNPFKFGPQGSNANNNFGPFKNDLPKVALNFGQLNSSSSAFKPTNAFKP